MPNLPDALSQIADLAALLRADPAGIGCDFDGTLSPIAPEPAAAKLPPATRAALAILADRIRLVAIVSGRPAAEVAALVGLPRLLVIGNHGLERLNGDQVDRPAEVAEYRPRLDELLRQAHRTLHMPGILIEDKTATLSLHYRRSHDPPAARVAILAWVTAAAADLGLVVSEGRRVVEIRPPLAINKGSAVRDLIAEFGLRTMVYLGDDRTDLDAFRALQAWRDETGGQAVAIAVRGGHPALLECADYQLADPPAAGAFLAALAGALTPPASSA